METLIVIYLLVGFFIGFGIILDKAGKKDIPISIEAIIAITELLIITAIWPIKVIVDLVKMKK